MKIRLIAIPLAAILAAGSILLTGCSNSSSDGSTEEYSYTPTIDTATRMDIENVYTTKGKVISGKESSQNLRSTLISYSSASDSTGASDTDSNAAASGTDSASDGTGAASAASSVDSDSIIIKDVLVSVGDRVKAGDVLYTIDTSQIEKDLATAEQKQALNDQQNALTQAANQRALANAQADSADSYRDSNYSLTRGADDTNKAIETQLEDDQKYQQYLQEENTKKAVYDDLKNQVDNLQQDVYSKTDLVTSLTRQRDARVREIDKQNNSVTENVSNAGSSQTNDNPSDGDSDDQGKQSSNYLSYSNDETYVSLSNQLTQATYDLEDAQTALTRKQAELSTAEADYTTAKSNRETYESQVKSDAQATESARRALEDQKSSVNRTNRSENDAEANAANAIASQNITKALSDLDSQETISKLKEKLENNQVVATMDGTVTAVNVVAGQAYSGSDGVVLDNLSKMKVSADIDEKYIADLKVGTKVRVKTDSTGDDVLTGEVTFASPTPTDDTANKSAATSAATTTASSNTSNSTSRAKYKVEITLDEPNDRLRIGMTANIDFIIASASNAIAVPSTALMDDGNGGYYLSVVTGSGSGAGEGGAADSTESSSFIASDGSTIGWTPIEDTSGAEAVEGSTAGFTDSGNADGSLSQDASDGGTLDMNNLNTEDIMVTIGVSDGTWTEITSGNIQEGEQILDQSASGSGDYSSMTDGMYADS